MHLFFNQILSTIKKEELGRSCIYAFLYFNTHFVPPFFRPHSLPDCMNPVLLFALILKNLPISIGIGLYIGLVFLDGPFIDSRIDPL